MRNQHQDVHKSFTWIGDKHRVLASVDPHNYIVTFNHVWIMFEWMFGVNHIVFDSHLNMRVCNSTCMPAMDMFIAYSWFITYSWPMGFNPFENWKRLVGILLPNMVEITHKIWLVVSTYPSEKYEFVSWDYYSQYMESHKSQNWIHQPSHYISIKCHGSLGNLGNFGAHLPARHSQTVTKWRRIPVQIAKANPTPWGFDRVNHRLSYGPMDLYPGCGEKNGWVTGFHWDHGFIIMSWTS